MEEFNGASRGVFSTSLAGGRGARVELSQKDRSGEKIPLPVCWGEWRRRFDPAGAERGGPPQTIISLTDKARELEEKYDEVSERANLLFFKGVHAGGDRGAGSLLKVLVNLERSENDLKEEKGRNKMAKVTRTVYNDFCPQTLFLYGNYKRTARRILACSAGSVIWLEDGLGVMACIGEDKLTKGPDPQSRRVFRQSGYGGTAAPGGLLRQYQRLFCGQNEASRWSGDRF